MASSGGAVEWIDATGRTLIVRDNPVDNREIQAALHNRCPLWQPSVLMRRDAFECVGGYRPPFAPAEDYDLWLRMAEHFQIANLVAVILKYRIHPYQVSIRRRAQQTLGILAARAAAKRRANGLSDPMSEVREITPETLAAIGIPFAQQRNAFVSDSWQWIQNMCLAGEYVSALNATLEILQSDLRDSPRRQVADLHLVAAKLLWGERQFLNGMISAGHAALLRPIVAARPLKLLLRKLRRVPSAGPLSNDASPGGG